MLEPLCLDRLDARRPASPRPAQASLFRDDD